jgi:hypothetical protein
MNNETLIAELSATLKPIKPASACRVRIARECAVVIAISLVGITALQGLRPDFAEQVREPLFLFELVLNLLLIIVSAAASIALAYPDSAHGKWLKPALLVTFFGYSGLVFMTASAPSTLDDMGHVMHHTIECMLCILSYAALPALWILWRTRKLAPVRPLMSGVIALMMATSVGCLGVRLVESENVADGTVLWHYMPLVLFSALGLLFGKKIFRW